jgi:hypothetical protein
MRTELDPGYGGEGVWGCYAEEHRALDQNGMARLSLSVYCRVEMPTFRTSTQADKQVAVLEKLYTPEMSSM